MKKVVKIIMGLLLILTVKRVNASTVELKYSDWSTFYPSGLDEVFIESELRYKWYKFEDNKVVFYDKYESNLDGYIKDEGSERTFYRYITNEFLYFNGKNEMVMDTDYCIKNFCYLKLFTKPTLINSSNKTENKYSEAALYEYTSEVVPYTGDFILYSVIGLIASVGILTLIMVKKRRKMSYE